MVKSSWIKPGAVVIDCGISRIEDSSRKSGSRLVGDVDFEGVKSVCTYIYLVLFSMYINNTL